MRSGPHMSMIWHPVAQQSSGAGSRPRTLTTDSVAGAWWPRPRDLDTDLPAPAGMPAVRPDWTRGDRFPFRPR